ncbi:MAG: hypothetical protein KatS3mg115_2643 [Candidatus Poribacteria bacterium]|nr:MAG: hypothetical protein KatS3mg115_2643 [Candidatus Poribacteria bacterium]
MQFAVFTVSQPETTPEEAMEQLVRIGYAGVEWRITVDRDQVGPSGVLEGETVAPSRADWEDEAFQRVAERMREHGLRCPNLGTYLSHSDLEGIERMMQVARIFGSPSIRVGVPRYDGSRPYPELFSETVARYERGCGAGRTARREGPH